MTIGSAVHEAAQKDNLEKIRTGEPLKLAQMVDAAVAAFDEKARQEGLEVTNIEAGRGKDSAVQAATGYGVHISPLIPRPVEAETASVVRIGDIELAGIIDYGDAQGIYDLKVGRRHPAGSAAKSSQLSIYGFLRRARTGVWPERVGLDIVRPGLKGRPWIADRQLAPRTEGDYSALIERLKATQAAVTAGVFLPAAEGEFTCDARWCEFWKDCKYVSPARRAAAEQRDES